ncbi:ISAs1 family transposase [Nitrincola tibetensis]|uniref:ISAs1 family transposase n=2 Tax=Nitrincola tibetensis TaxID=2219697 RepID=A0A364NMX4_9GAMM|nr:ISAs1 family transposase [Nitrincola tibetensis]
MPELCREHGMSSAQFYKWRAKFGGMDASMMKRLKELDAELLKLLEIRGCLVTLDTMGCQRAIAKAIIDKEADYLLAVKGNQPRLEKAFKEHFPMSRLLQYEGDCFSTTESSHGRKETRLYVVSDVFDEFVNLSFDWPGMKRVGVVISFRQEDETIRDHAQVRYYISSKS